MIFIDSDDDDDDDDNALPPVVGSAAAIATRINAGNQGHSRSSFQPPRMSLTTSSSGRVMEVIDLVSSDDEDVPPPPPPPPPIRPPPPPGPPPSMRVVPTSGGTSLAHPAIAQRHGAQAPIAPALHSPLIMARLQVLNSYALTAHPSSGSSPRPSTDALAAPSTQSASSASASKKRPLSSSDTGDGAASCKKRPNSFVPVKLEIAKPLQFGEADIPGEIEEVRDPDGDDTADGDDEAIVLNDDDDEVACIGGNIQGLSDMPHSRHDCSVFKFMMNHGNTTLVVNANNQKHCPMCFCLVCDVKAVECTDWKSHCDASHKNEFWKVEKALYATKLFGLLPPARKKLLADFLKALQSSHDRNQLYSTRIRQLKDIRYSDLAVGSSALQDEIVYALATVMVIWSRIDYVVGGGYASLVNSESDPNVMLFKALCDVVIKRDLAPDTIAALKHDLDKLHTLCESSRTRYSFCYGYPMLIATVDLARRVAQAGRRLATMSMQEMQAIVDRAPSPTLRNCLVGAISYSGRMDIRARAYLNGGGRSALTFLKLLAGHVDSQLQTPQSESTKLSAAAFSVIDFYLLDTHWAQLSSKLDDRVIDIEVPDLKTISVHAVVITLAVLVRHRTRMTIVKCINAFPELVYFALHGIAGSALSSDKLFEESLDLMGPLLTPVRLQDPQAWLPLTGFKASNLAAVPMQQLLAPVFALVVGYSTGLPDRQQNPVDWEIIAMLGTQLWHAVPMVNKPHVLLTVAKLLLRTNSAPDWFMSMLLETWVFKSSLPSINTKLCSGQDDATIFGAGRQPPVAIASYVNKWSNLHAEMSSAGFSSTVPLSIKIPLSCLSSHTGPAFGGYNPAIELAKARNIAWIDTLVKLEPCLSVECSSKWIENIVVTSALKRFLKTTEPVVDDPVTACMKACWKTLLGLLPKIAMQSKIALSSAEDSFLKSYAALAQSAYGSVYATDSGTQFSEVWDIQLLKSSHATMNGPREDVLLGFMVPLLIAAAYAANSAYCDSYNDPAVAESKMNYGTACRRLKYALLHINYYLETGQAVGANIAKIATNTTSIPAAEQQVYFQPRGSFFINQWSFYKHVLTMWCPKVVNLDTTSPDFSSYSNVLPVTLPLVVLLEDKATMLKFQENMLAKSHVSYVSMVLSYFNALRWQDFASSQDVRQSLDFLVRLINKFPTIAPSQDSAVSNISGLITLCTAFPSLSSLVLSTSFFHSSFIIALVDRLSTLNSEHLGGEGSVSTVDVTMWLDFKKMTIKPLLIKRLSNVADLPKAGQENLLIIAAVLGFDDLLFNTLATLNPPYQAHGRKLIGPAFPSKCATVSSILEDAVLAFHTLMVNHPLAVEAAKSPVFMNLAKDVESGTLSIDHSNETCGHALFEVLLPIDESKMAKASPPDLDLLVNVGTRTKGLHSGLVLLPWIVDYILSLAPGKLSTERSSPEFAKVEQLLSTLPPAVASLLRDPNLETIKAYLASPLSMPDAKATPATFYWMHLTLTHFVVVSFLLGKLSTRDYLVLLCTGFTVATTLKWKDDYEQSSAIQDVFHYFLLQNYTDAAVDPLLADSIATMLSFPQFSREIARGMFKVIWLATVIETNQSQDMFVEPAGAGRLWTGAQFDLRGPDETLKRRIGLLKGAVDQCALNLAPASTAAVTLKFPYLNALAFNEVTHVNHQWATENRVLIDIVESRMKLEGWIQISAGFLDEKLPTASAIVEQCRLARASEGLARHIFLASLNLTESDGALANVDMFLEQRSYDLLYSQLSRACSKSPAVISAILEKLTGSLKSHHFTTNGLNLAQSLLQTDKQPLVSYIIAWVMAVQDLIRLSAPIPRSDSCEPDIISPRFVSFMENLKTSWGNNPFATALMDIFCDRVNPPMSLAHRLKAALPIAGCSGKELLIIFQSIVKLLCPLVLHATVKRSLFVNIVVACAECCQDSSVPSDQQQPSMELLALGQDILDSPYYFTLSEAYTKVPGGLPSRLLELKPYTAVYVEYPLSANGDRQSGNPLNSSNSNSRWALKYPFYANDPTGRRSSPLLDAEKSLINKEIAPFRTTLLSDLLGAHSHPAVFQVFESTLLSSLLSMRIIDGSTGIGTAGALVPSLVIPQHFQDVLKAISELPPPPDPVLRFYALINNFCSVYNKVVCMNELQGVLESAFRRGRYLQDILAVYISSFARVIRAKNIPIDIDGCMFYLSRLLNLIKLERRDSSVTKNPSVDQKIQIVRKAADDLLAVIVSRHKIEDILTHLFQVYITSGYPLEMLACLPNKEFVGHLVHQTIFPDATPSKVTIHGVVLDVDRVKRSRDYSSVLRKFAGLSDQVEECDISSFEALLMNMERVAISVRGTTMTAPRKQSLVSLLKTLKQGLQDTPRGRACLLNIKKLMNTELRSKKAVIDIVNDILV